MTLLPDGLLAQYQEINDAFVTELGKTCQLIYASAKVACSNCIVDTITLRSTGVYKAGGPNPFANGDICPHCDGVGFFLTEASDDVQARIYWDAKEWFKLGIPIDKSSTTVQVRGFLSDLPKYEQCEYLQRGNQRFQRITPMVPYGLGEDRYVLGFWKQVN